MFLPIYINLYMFLYVPIEHLHLQLKINNLHS